MVQVKIYGLKTPLMAHADLLSAAIHNAIVEALVYSPEKKFQRLIGLEKSEFIYPADRSENYTIIEISMFEGRLPTVGYANDRDKEIIDSIAIC
jgi:hypothetical protein